MKYVIITYKIVEIGGAQQYCQNKGIYLEQRGFDVIIFSGVQGNVYIDYLKKFAKYIFEGYDGLAVLSTVDSVLGIVSLFVAPGREREADQVLDALAREIRIEEMPLEGLAPPAIEK